MILAKVLPVLLLVKSAALAQSIGGTLLATEKYTVRQYNSENGLPQNSTSDLLLDQNDFLWIATQNGLVRFDGQRFRIYNSSNTTALKVNRFSIISETLQHQILFSSNFADPEIYKLTPDYRILVDSAATLLRHKLISPHSNGIFDGARLFQYYAKNVSPLIDSVFLENLCKSDSYAILNDHEIVIQFQGDSYYLNNLSGSVIKLPIKRGQNTAHHDFFSGNIYCVPLDSGGILFFENGRQINIAVDGAVAGLLNRHTSLPAPKFQIYSKGKQLILRRNNDFYALGIDDGRLTANLIFKDLYFLENMPASSVLYDNSGGRLFVGTLTEGLFVISKRVFNTLTFKRGDYSNNIFTAFLPLPDGRFLTSNGILDTGADRSSFLFGDGDKPDKNCLYKAKDGSIWFSKEKRLYTSDSGFSRIMAFDSLALDTYITSVIEDTGRRLWISTLDCLLKIEKGKPRYILNRYPPFIYHPIESIREISPGIMWIATRKGLYEYDMAADSINPRPLLPDLYVRSIYKAKDNSIWIGTYGNGFLAYDKGRFVPLPLDPQKYLATAHTFLEDDLGFFWISTNHGLFKIRKKDLDRTVRGDTHGYFVYYYDKTYGFNTNEFNGGCSPAAWKDKKGNFYFPSLNGIVYFQPDSIRSELPDRPIFINRVLADSILPDEKREIQLPPDFNHLTVDVSTPFYGLEDNLHLEYKLDPMDVSWTAVDKAGRITINRLLAGKYSLTIRKMSGWGDDNFSYALFRFEVLPYWYNSAIVKALLVALLIGFIIALFMLRTKILRRQNYRLQEKVEERTLELEQSTLLKEKLISVIMHDLRSPLFSQSMLIDYLVERYSELNQSEVRDILGNLSDSSNKMCQFSTDFLTWYNSHKQGFSVNREAIDLKNFVTETGGFYRDMARRKGISIEYAVGPDLTIFSDRNILSTIIRNLIDNAVKYTGSGSIRIMADRVDEWVRIRIQDSGPGMTAGKISEILSYMDLSADKATATFGYRFVTELVRKLSGTLDIASEAGKGTLVTISLRA
jgi:signal transduction histidine kinase